MMEGNKVGLTTKTGEWARMGALMANTERQWWLIRYAIRKKMRFISDDGPLCVAARCR